MLCPNGTVKPFLVSLVEPVAYLKSELFGGFPGLRGAARAQRVLRVPLGLCAPRAVCRLRTGRDRPASVGIRCDWTRDCVPGFPAGTGGRALSPTRYGAGAAAGFKEEHGNSAGADRDSRGRGGGAGSTKVSFVW